MRKTLALLFFALAPLHAEDDSFRERFADPATRIAALTELIPGTQTAYFHTALDHQIAGREEAFKATLAEWKAASTRKENPIPDAGIAVLEQRQLLMDYQKSPVPSLAELIRRLDLRFDDNRPDAAAAAQSLPTRIDPALVSEEAFEKAAAAAAPENTYTLYTGTRLLKELDQVEKFDERKISWFLDNIGRADLPGIVPLMDRALAFDRILDFEHPLLAKLTSQQMAMLLELRPDLRARQTFVLSYLRKLLPGAETNLERDPRALAEHVKKCRDFALTLPPALNTLKGHILYHHLRLQQELGNYPKEDFLAYLALPRSVHTLLRVPEQAPQFPLRFGSDFASATECPPVEDDAPLIRAFLEHLLGQTDSAAEFAPFVGEKELARIHARARLLAGGDAARWGTVIDPADFKTLQNESVISFAPGAPSTLDADAAVSLTLDLKNTPDVLIRIYELDVPAHLTNHGAEPDVSIDLDGLVPHHQRGIRYSQAPILRHRENIALPELAGAGVWLVDITGGQVSARALIRKGRIVTYVERNADSQSIRVFDEKNHPVAGAIFTLGSETFTSDASGPIIIPNAGDQALTNGIVRVGKLAVPVTLDSRMDDIAMDARFHLDREQLLADKETSLQLRVRLTNHGHEIPLDRIKDPALVMKAELVGGVTTERVLAENLALQPTMEIPFQVPADLLKLTLTLRGTVTPATGGDLLKLNQDAVYQINGDLLQANVATTFFSPTTEGHRMEVRGRNGEPLASSPLTIRFYRDDYKSTYVELEARTDASGRVDLGKMDTVDRIEVHGASITEAHYHPEKGENRYTGSIQVSAGKEIRLPLLKPLETPNHVELSLLETRRGSTVRDHFEKISINSGQLVLRGLPPGDFTLTQGKKITQITVSPSAGNDGLLVSNTRILPVHVPANPTITKAAVENGQLTIRLRDAGPDTRISLVGKRYLHPTWEAGEALLPFAAPVSDTVQTGFSDSGYLTDRRISDEMRYILDRRAALAFPGSMLPRPGLLLNRWNEEDLDSGSQTGAEGSEGNLLHGGVENGSRHAFRQNASKRSSPAILAVVSDFLQFPAAVHFDLKPDAEGVVTLPLAKFEGSQFIEIVAADKFASDQMLLPLAASETPLRDRRIARPLDPKGHHLATRSAAVLQKDAQASIENLLDADWRAFTTLAEAHQFLYGMTPDDRLREFIFLTEWPSLPEEKKLALLSDHACHELHLFLARKDRPFFDKFVKPLLAGKPEPQFMDDYLLEKDLSAYLRPYAWHKLNAAEKALLSQALPAARDRIARELGQRWELEAPAPDAETQLFTQTLRGSDLAMQDSLGLARRDLESDTYSYGSAQVSSGVAYLSDKLKRIIIPRIDFEDVTVYEALDFLRLRANELDTTELDPSKKGINLVTRGAGTGNLRIRELRLRNVPFATALKYIADQTKLRYKVDDFAVTMVPATESGEDLFTRVIDVPPDFLDSLAGGANPFGGLSRRGAIIDLLKSAGISFGSGTSATLSPAGKLLVTNAASELDKIEQLTATLRSEAPDSRYNQGAAPDPFADATALPPLELPSESTPDPLAASDPFAEAATGGAAKLTPRQPISPAPANRPAFFDRTKLWKEANYYRNSKPADETLIPLNRFWLDLAAWDGKGAFLSPHFNACHTTANEALMCLALLDLPFKADRPEAIVDGSTLRVKAREPMLLFYKDTRSTGNLAQESPLLVRQTFTPLAEPFRTVNGRQIENPVTGDFRPGVAYAASLIVTNPTGIGRRIDLLAQIPAGAIPLKGKPATQSSTHELKPYGVVMEELAFYFPAAGEFTVYPLHVSEEGTILAHTDPRTLRVSDEPAPQDAASWGVLANEGSDQDVLTRLNTENLKTIDLSQIRWRLKDPAFFLEVSKILRERLFFSTDVASFGFLHNDVSAMREYLENSGAADHLGRWLDSPLLDVRPRVHLAWETLEFDPLVNPRIHRFGDESRLNNEAAKKHYHQFLDNLAWKPSLDAPDLLGITAFLFLQDRTQEALARFDQIDPAKLPGRLNYDYVQAVALFHREKPEEARAIATRYLPTLAPGLWKDRFQAVIDQADEIAALDRPDDARKPDQEKPAPELDLALADGGKLSIKHRSLEKTTLRLFSVDLEVLFSKNPFLQADGKDGGQPAIRPNESFEVALSKDSGETFIELPEGLRKGNVLVSADSGSTKLLRVLDSRALELRHSPEARTVQVLDTVTRKPLTKTYIKVYAETESGEIVFHKDGYTDLRGKFDYLSHTGTSPANLKRFAILASHPEKGARTVIYAR